MRELYQKLMNNILFLFHNHFKITSRRRQVLADDDRIIDFITN